MEYHAVISHIDIWRSLARDAGNRHTRSVFSPDLWQPDELMLRGRALICLVKTARVEPLEIPAGEYATTHRVPLVMADGVSVEAWYDKQGIPLRWSYPEKGYDIFLTDIRHITG